MAQVCPAWEEVVTIVAGPGQDALDASNAHDWGGESAAFDTIAQSAAGAQRLLRYLPSWNKPGGDYVQRLVREAAAWHKTAVQGAKIALEYGFITQADLAEFKADWSEMTTAMDQRLKMETVLKDRYGFNCTAWLTRPPPTPTPSPTAALPGA